MSDNAEKDRIIDEFKRAWVNACRNGDSITRRTLIDEAEEKLRNAGFGYAIREISVIVNTMG